MQHLVADPRTRGSRSPEGEPNQLPGMRINGKRGGVHPRRVPERLGQGTLNGQCRIHVIGKPLGMPGGHTRHLRTRGTNLKADPDPLPHNRPPKVSNDPLKTPTSPEKPVHPSQGVPEVEGRVL